MNKQFIRVAFTAALAIAASASLAATPMDDTKSGNSMKKGAAMDHDSMMKNQPGAMSDTMMKDEMMKCDKMMMNKSTMSADDKMKCNKMMANKGSMSKDSMSSGSMSKDSMKHDSMGKGTMNKDSGSGTVPSESKKY